MNNARPFSRAPSGILLVVLATAVLILLSLDLGENDLIAGDEGYYGIMARNISHGWDYVANPSLSPLGPPGDKPFLYPLLLAGAIEVGGVDEVPLRLLTLVIAMAAGIFLFLIGRELGFPEAGAWATLLFLSSSFLGHWGRRVAAEVPLVTLALAGVWLFLRGLQARHFTRGLLAGILFGLAFLCKLWLVLPPMGAAVGGGLVGCIAIGRRRKESLAAWRQAALATGLGFLLAGSLQVLLCSVLTPETVPHWLDVYFGFSLFGRVGGEEFAAYWHKPWSHYLLLLIRTAGLWLPAACLGILTLFASAGKAIKRALPVAVLLIWLLPLLPMSLFSVKSGSYTQSLMPALFLLAGFGLEHLSKSGFSWKQYALGAALIVSLGLAANLKLAGGGSGVDLHSPITITVQMLWMIAIAWFALRRGRAGRTSRIALVACLILTLLGGLARDIQLVRARDHVTGYSKLAERVETGFRDLDPRDLCFIAPEWPALSFYTFRSGRYWESPYVPSDPQFTRGALAGSRPFLFVVQSDRLRLYGGSPDEKTSTALESAAHLLKPDAAWKSAGLQVYGNTSLRDRLATAQAQRGS